MENCVGIFIIALPLVLLAIELLIGGMIEKNHLRSLSAREHALDGFLITSLKMPPASSVSSSRLPKLVMGEAVISSD